MNQAFHNPLPGLPLVESPLFAAALPGMGLDEEEERIARDLHETGFAVLDFPMDDFEAVAERMKAALAETPQLADMAHSGPDHPVERAIQVQVYSIPHGKHGVPDETHPVLLSYIDVVVQGYLREFGEAGVQRFFETTDGWDAPILNDRAAPIYSRTQVLHDDEIGLVEDGLREVDARIITRV